MAEKPKRRLIQIAELICSLTQEIPDKKSVRIRTLDGRIRTLFGYTISKNSGANQKRASECLADWTVLGRAKVYAKIGFATHCNLGDVNPMISSLGNFQHFGLFRKFVFSITLGCILQQIRHLRV